jgi:hypothetical protein
LYLQTLKLAVFWTQPSCSVAVTVTVTVTVTACWKSYVYFTFTVRLIELEEIKFMRKD